jgi:Antirestriction protein
MNKLTTDRIERLAGLTAANAAYMALKTTTEVPAGKRATEMSRQFGVQALNFELAVYTVADRLLDTYKGGMWAFWRLRQSGFYMTPPAGEGWYRVSVDTNGYEGNVTTEAAGIIVCLFVYSELSFTNTPRVSSRMTGLFHSLREYVTSGHPERAAILAAID